MRGLLCLLVVTSVQAQKFDVEARSKALKCMKASELFGSQGSVVWQAWLDSAQKADPTFAQPLLEKARVHNMRGDFQAGFTLMNKAIRLDSVNALGYQAWYKLYYLRDYAGARHDLLTTDQLTPKIVDYPGGEHLYYLLGMAEAGLENNEQALAYFDRYVEDETNRSGGERWVRHLAYLRQAAIYFQLSDYPSATGALDKALSHSTNLVEAHYYKGLIALRLGDKTSAAKSLYKALELLGRGYQSERWFYIDNGYPLEKATIQEKLAQATGLR